MYTKISSLYNYPETNKIGTNTFQTNSFNRNLNNDNYRNLSVNDMNYLPNYIYMSDPKKDKVLLQNMRDYTNEYDKIQNNKKIEDTIVKIQSSSQGLPSNLNSSNTTNNTSNNTTSNTTNNTSNKIDNQSFENYKTLTMTKEKGIYNLESPQVFGPPLWFVIHNAAIHYPIENPSPETKSRMKNFLLSLPVLVPCVRCKEHCIANIERYKDKIDDILNSRKKLFEFTVDFHNKVNSATGKSQLSYEEAYNIYSGKVEIEIPKFYS